MLAKLQTQYAVKEKAQAEAAAKQMAKAEAANSRRLIIATITRRIPTALTIFTLENNDLLVQPEENGYEFPVTEADGKPDEFTNPADGILGEQDHELFVEDHQPPTDDNNNELLGAHEDTQWDGGLCPRAIQCKGSETEPDSKPDQPDSHHGQLPPNKHHIKIKGKATAETNSAVPNAAPPKTTLKAFPPPKTTSKALPPKTTSKAPPPKTTSKPVPVSVAVTKPPTGRKSGLKAGKKHVATEDNAAVDNDKYPVRVAGAQKCTCTTPA
ncbi:hypothetical protein V5O48_010207 [Marasmius crinis-equi]|uniref:Uncharacterized protein n=1 Tax=Marasmius crinis-equi TaxID=585013 RepID=A0ABR3F957_9AGAR